MGERKTGGRIHPGLYFLIILPIPFWGQSGVRAMGVEPAVILTKQDNGKEARVRGGQSFQVRLEGMGGTGYWWYVQPLDGRHVDLISEKTEAGKEGRVGGPSLGIWTFRAKDPGTTEIKMDYYRAWEGVERAAERFRVKIIVE